MSWEVKYQTGTVDLLGQQWRVDIEEEDYSGGVTTLTGATETPIAFDRDNQDDTPFDPIRSSMVTVSVIGDSNFALADLYAVEDRHFRMSIYLNSVLYWIGYVDCGEYREEYDVIPHIIEIVGTCGLKYLEQIRYDDSGVAYEGRTSKAQIIMDILQKIGYDSFTEFINIYEDSMNDTVDDSPLDQAELNREVFQDKYCIEVLYYILRAFNAVIIQREGQFVIYRPVELVNDVIYGRIFTVESTPLIKTSTSFSPRTYINRSTNPSWFHQIPNGVQMVQSPAKKVVLTQDYGYKESWIKNWQLKGETWNDSAQEFDDWTEESGTSVGPVSLFDEGEASGMAILTRNAYPTLDKFVSASFATYGLYSAGDGFIVDFEYGFWLWPYSEVAAGLMSFRYTIVTPNGWYLKGGLDGDGDPIESEWTKTPSYVNITNSEILPAEFSGWSNHRLGIQGIPENGPFEIRIYGIDESMNAVYPFIRNIKVFASSVEVRMLITYSKLKVKTGVVFFDWLFSPKEPVRTERVITEFKEVAVREYTKEVSPAINGRELEYENIIGDVNDSGIDNVMEQFAGSISLNVIATLIQAAAAFVSEHYSDYSDGGVVLSWDELSDGDIDVIFTAAVAGVAFTGATSIANVTGDINGTLEPAKQTANVAAVARVDTILLSGTSGSFRILCEGVTQDGDFTSDINTTASTFVSDHAAEYLSGGNVILTAVGATLYFTAKTAGTDFVLNDINFLQLSEDMDGSITSPATPNQVPVKQVSTITLSGSSGTANITCDAETQLISMEQTIAPTNGWRKQGESTSEALLQMMTDEISTLYSRPRQLLQIPIIERVLNIGGSEDIETFDVMCCISDDLNMYDESNKRLFVFNRGRFDVKRRLWDMDLVEIGLEEIS